MIKIRQGGREDLGVWSRLRAVLWPSMTAAQHETDLAASIVNPAFRGWLAFDRDEPVGFSEAYLRPFANGCEHQPVVFLEGIYVGAPHRSLGVARLLLAAVEDWARALGMSEIGSDAELQNTLAYTCHIRWGFSETERVVYFRKSLS